MKFRQAVLMAAVSLSLFLIIPVHAKFSRGEKKSVRMIVFNQTGQSIELQLLLDGKMVYEDKVAIAEKRPAIVEERSFLLKPGKHKLQLKDVTRKFKDERKFELQELANILIFLDKNQMSVEINDRDKLAFQ